MVFLLERKGLELVLIAKAEGGSVCKYSLFTGFFSLVLVTSAAYYDSFHAI